MLFKVPWSISVKSHEGAFKLFHSITQDASQFHENENKEKINKEQKNKIKKTTTLALNRGENYEKISRYKIGTSYANIIDIGLSLLRKRESESE